MIDFENRVILSPKNVDVFTVNNEILSKMEGDVKEYISVDIVQDDNNFNLKKSYLQNSLIL